MFLGLAVFLVLALVASILVFRLIRALFRILKGEKKEDQEKEAASKEESKKEQKQESIAESKSESKELEQGPSEEEQAEAELMQARHEYARYRGITEEFAPEGKLIEIDPKTAADLCVSGSGLTYLEFNNRELASEEFYGFNLIIEKDTRMVLTYNGQAVASITAVETRATATINGQEVEGTAPGMRINTFPPSLKPGMVPSDLEKMLGAAERIRACGNDPAMVADCMLSEFTDPENVRRLKNAVDQKIQSKESSLKQSQGQAQKPEMKKGPIKL